MTEKPGKPVVDSTRPLVAAATRGDADAVETLIGRHLGALHAYVRLHAGPELRRLEATADLVQSACREVLVDLQDHVYTSEGDFRRWLFTSAMRKIQDKGRHWRAERRDRDQAAGAVDGQGLAIGRDIVGVYAAYGSPGADVELRDRVARLEEAFDDLSERERAVIVGRRLLDASYAELAEDLGTTEGNVRKLFSRATSRLLRILES